MVAGVDSLLPRCGQTADFPMVISCSPWVVPWLGSDCLPAGLFEASSLATNWFLTA